jgi:rabenosyn-5
MAAFGLKTRRHHCRLCGRVVCFLPPTAPLPPPSTSSDAPPTTIPAPSRKERCSSFFTCEYEGIADGGEKKPIGVIIELAEPEPDSSLGGVVLDATSVKMGKDDRKKVRVCRECLSVVLYVYPFAVVRLRLMRERVGDNRTRRCR